MDANTRGAGADSPDSPVRVPHCRVVWDAAGAEVGVWVANGDEPGWVRRQRVEVITEFADRALEHVRDELPGAEMAVDAVEALRDPRTIVSLTIAAVAQVAAVHAGIPVTAAKLIGDAAGRLGQRLLAGESDRDQDPAVRYLDFDYDTQACAPRPEDPPIEKAGRGSRHDAVGELLDRRGTQTRGNRGDRSRRGTALTGCQPGHAARGPADESGGWRRPRYFRAGSRYRVEDCPWRVTAGGAR